MSRREWMRRGAAACVPAALAIVLAAGPAAGQMAGSGADALARVKKYTPAAAAGVGYINVAAFRAKLDAQITVEQRRKAPLVKTFLALAKKIDWVVVVLPPNFERHGPLLVLHGKLTADDVATFAGAMDDKKLKFQKRANGRYDSKGRLTIIVGAEADDLDDGVALVGQTKLLTATLLAGLGKITDDALAALVKPVDTTAPVWLAMTFPAGPDRRSEMKSLAVTGYPLGEKASLIALVCGEAEIAKEIAGAMMEMDRTVPSLKGLTRVTRDGPTVRIQIKADASLPSKLVAAMIVARQRAAEAMSMAKLRQIAVALQAYAADQDGRLPPDFGALKEHLGSAGMFVSNLSGRKPPKFEKGKLVGETDYVYILTAVAPSADPPKRLRMSQIQAPSKFILAYERPENYGKRGTAAAFLDGHVEFLSSEKFKAALEQTRKQLKDAGW